MLTALAKKEYSLVTDKSKFRYPSFSMPIIAVLGGFGSGKTEVSVNLAKYLARTGNSSVSIADLDLVNPYFRSREAIIEMESLGIRVIAPGGENYYSDLPILLPEVKGAVESRDGIVILDVGGDSQGTKALGSISEVFQSGSYDMLMVLNSRRPQTSDVDNCIKTMQRIEQTAGLQFTGLVSNSHMIEETDADIIKEGYDLAKDVSRVSGLPLVFISAKSEILEVMDIADFECPVLPLTRSMLKPWERHTGENENKVGE
jgi:hypothetical protein